MFHLVISIMSALTVALFAYAETSSLLLAFAAYSLTGTISLSTALLSGFLDMRAETDHVV